MDEIARAIRDILRSEGWLTPDEARILQAEMAMLRERLHDKEQQLALSRLRSPMSVLQ